jgi:lactate dehydrogenase-like 2-hydroxyacid dehydrogenase
MNDGSGARYALPNAKTLNVLVTREFQSELKEPIEANYTAHNHFDAKGRLDWLKANGAKIEAVLTSGIVGLKADEIALMPNLKIVQVFAAGYETVDVPALKARGIMMCNVPGQNAGCVADHAMGMLVAVTRRFLQADAKIRTGVFDDTNNSTPRVSGKKLGIVGLGSVGREVAKRAAAFDMEIGYRNRKPRSDVPYRYFDSVAALAEWADYLITCTPGGAETNHIVNADILKRLGKRGYYINVARGSVADTKAVVAALNDGTIAGAALDVVEGEPDKIDPSVLTAPNLLLTPHGAGRAPEQEADRLHTIRTNFENHLTGKPVVSPVKEMAG